MNTMDVFFNYRTNSKGPFQDPVARVHPNIMFGPAIYLTPEFIRDNNITHNVNCAYDMDVPSFVQETLGDKYSCINAMDSYLVNICDWYPQFEKAMDRYLRDNDCKMIYVNCQAGMNRSGFLIVLYCCMKFSYHFDSLTKSIVTQRPCALQNMVFYEQVVDYIKKHR